MSIFEMIQLKQNFSETESQILATDNYEQDYICQQMTSKDCAMFISYGGRHQSFDRYVQILRRKGVSVLALTANKDCFIAKYSNHCICIPDLEKEAKIATFYSQMVFQYILNLIFSILYRNHSLE